VNERYCDMALAGVVDRAKVVRTAVENAASVAGMILTTETLIADAVVQEAQQVGAEQYV